MGVVYVPEAVQEKLEPMQYVKALHELIVHSSLLNFTFYNYSVGKI